MEESRAVLGPSWSLLGGSWGLPGGILRPLGGGLLGSVGGVCWGYVAAANFLDDCLSDFGPIWDQKASKIDPKMFKNKCCGNIPPTDHSKRPQECPKRPQDLPKRPQDLHKRHQNRPKRPSDPVKKPPKPSQFMHSYTYKISRL